MKQLRVYVDTSVIGGCFDPEFAQWSNALLRDFEMGFFRPVLSKAVESEVLSAPEQVREKYAELLALGAEFVPVTNEANELVGFQAHGEAAEDSALQRSEPGTGMGYKAIQIYSPREVTTDEQGV